MKKLLSYSIVISFVLLFSACAYKAPVPNGFAEFDYGDDFKAVNPEGVVYRVKVLENDPKADLEYWTEAVRTRMEHSGYKEISKEEFKGTLPKLSSTKYVAPYKGKAYQYQIVIGVDGDDIYLLEAAGELEKMAEYQKDIDEAIKKIGKK